jgi:hypothetical protein
LPIGIYEQDLAAIFGEGDRQISRQGGFTGPAFLCDNRDPHPPLPHRN